MPQLTKTEHPKEQHQKPPFAEPRQKPPGLDSEMRNKADHGEESYRGSGRLKEKTALITGGDSGIGRAVAIAFAREGADVAISYLPEEERDAKESARCGSFLNARFKGNDQHEAAWFSVSASTPGVSMSAGRAVHQILSAAARGRAAKVLGLPAQLLALIHGVFPGLTADVLGLVSRALPDGRGTGSRSMEPYIRNSKLLNSLTVLGRRAAEVYLEQPEHQTV